MSGNFIYGKFCKHNSTPHLSSQHSRHCQLWMYQPFSRPYHPMQQQVLHLQRNSCWSTERIINPCITHRPFTFSPDTFWRASVKRFTCLGRTQPNLHWPDVQPLFILTRHHQGCQYSQPYRHLEGHSQHKQRTLLHGPPIIDWN